MRWPTLGRILRTANLLHAQLLFFETVKNIPCKESRPHDAGKYERGNKCLKKSWRTVSSYLFYPVKCMKCSVRMDYYTDLALPRLSLLKTKKNPCSIVVSKNLRCPRRRWEFKSGPCVMRRVAMFGLFEAKKQIRPFFKIGWPRNFREFIKQLAWF